MEKKNLILLGVLGTLILIFCAGMAMDTSANTSEVGLNKIQLTTADAGITYSITINCSGVDNQIRIYGMDYIPQGGIQEFVLEQGSYSLCSGHVGHFAWFEVTSSGVVSYDSLLEGSVFLGEGTSMLTVVGHSVTINATGVDQQIGFGNWHYTNSFLGWIEPGTTKTYNLVVTGQYKYSLWTYLTLHFATVEVQSTGVITYDESQIGIIEGNETNVLTIIGHPITINATDVDLGSWSYSLSFLGWTEPGTTRTYNLVVNGNRKYDLWAYLTNQFATFEVQPTGVITYDESQIGIIGKRNKRAKNNRSSYHD